MHTHIFIYMYEFQSVALSKQCNSWQCCPACAVLPYLYVLLFFSVFRACCHFVTNKKGNNQKNLIKLCGLYMYTYIVYA